MMMLILNTLPLFEVCGPGAFVPTLSAVMILPILPTHKQQICNSNGVWVSLSLDVTIKMFNVFLDGC